jgi:hypothetical protein
MISWTERRMADLFKAAGTVSDDGYLKAPFIGH